MLKESNKSRFESYGVRKSVLNISHITFRDCRVHIFPTTFLEIAVYTAILRRVVGRRARGNPERYCGWLLSSLFFKEIGTRGHGRMFARAEGKQQK